MSTATDTERTSPALGMDAAGEVGGPRLRPHAGPASPACTPRYALPLLLLLAVEALTVAAALLAAFPH